MLRGRFLFVVVCLASPAAAAEIVWDDFSAGAQEQFWPGQEFQDWRNNQARALPSELFQLGRIVMATRTEPVLASVDTEVPDRLYLRRENPFPAHQSEYSGIHYQIDRRDLQSYQALDPILFAFDFDFAHTTHPVENSVGELQLPGKLRLGLQFNLNQFFHDVRIPVSDDPFTLFASTSNLERLGIITTMPTYAFPPPAPLETYEVQLSAVRVMLAVPEPSTSVLSMLLGATALLFPRTMRIACGLIVALWLSCGQMASAAEFVWDDFQDPQHFAPPGVPRPDSRGIAQLDPFLVTRGVTGGAPSVYTLSINTLVPDRLYLRYDNPTADRVLPGPAIDYAYARRDAWDVHFPAEQAARFRALMPGGRIIYDFDFFRTSDPTAEEPIRFYKTGAFPDDWIPPDFVGQFVEVPLEVSETPFSIELAYDELPEGGIKSFAPSIKFPSLGPGQSYELQMSGVRVFFIPEPSTSGVCYAICLTLAIVRRAGRCG